MLDDVQFPHTTSHPESSGDILAAEEIGVSRIQNTIAPSQTLIFFFNAVRIFLTWRERQALMARILVHILTFEMVLEIPSGTLSSNNKQAALRMTYCYITEKQTIMTNKIQYVVYCYRLPSLSLMI